MIEGVEKMTLHKSLKTSGALKRARNVLTRAERLRVLEDDGRWSEETSVFGLPKVRSYVIRRRHKTEKKEEAAAEGAVAEGAAPAAAAPAGKGAAAPAGKGAAPAAKGAGAPAAKAPAKGGKK
jgi:small basic protein (TIGR04137 family)